MMIGPGKLNAGGMPMSNLATALAPQVGRIVLDKTELTGNYDFELTYAPEALGSVGGPPLLNGGTVPVDPNAPVQPYSPAGSFRPAPGRGRSGSIRAEGSVEPAVGATLSAALGVGSTLSSTTGTTLHDAVRASTSNNP